MENYFFSNFWAFFFFPRWARWFCGFRFDELQYGQLVPLCFLLLLFFLVVAGARQKLLPVCLVDYWHWNFLLDLRLRKIVRSTIPRGIKVPLLVWASTLVSLRNQFGARRRKILAAPCGITTDRVTMIINVFCNLSSETRETDFDTLKNSLTRSAGTDLDTIQFKSVLIYLHYNLPS